MTRPYNRDCAEIFAAYRDRLEPVAVIPTIALPEAWELVEDVTSTKRASKPLCVGTPRAPDRRRTE